MSLPNSISIWPGCWRPSSAAPGSSTSPRPRSTGPSRPTGWTTTNNHKKDVELFETLAAINERFAKLQDTLASAMRHSALLMGEPTDSFLKVLAFFEKQGVIDAMGDWQRCRAVRNMAAHDYATDYGEIAEHFNLLHQFSDMLFLSARRLLELCDTLLDTRPASDDFTEEFNRLFA